MPCSQSRTVSTAASHDSDIESKHDETLTEDQDAENSRRKVDPPVTG